MRGLSAARHAETAVPVLAPALGLVLVLGLVLGLVLVSNYD